MTESLRRTTADTHQAIHEQLVAVTAAIHDNANRFDIVHAADQAIISVCQHQTAVCEVLLPLTPQSTPGHDSTVHEYVHQARRVEQVAGAAKARIYGGAQTKRTSWAHIWDRFETELDLLHEIEDSMVAELSARLDRAEQDQVVARMHTAALAAPTRPHPHSPHRGRFAHLTRVWWTRADRIWDATQGRGASRDAS